MPVRTQPTVALLRLALLLVLWFGLVGIQAELLLLKHTDGNWQLFPVVAIGAVLVVLVWYGLTRSAAPLRVLQILMLVLLVSGVLGVWQHMAGNLVYEQESDPSVAGRALYLRAVMGATPALAPGVMIQLALLGLAFTFRHPALDSSNRES